MSDYTEKDGRLKQRKMVDRLGMVICEKMFERFCKESRNPVFPNLKSKS